MLKNIKSTKPNRKWNQSKPLLYYGEILKSQIYEEQGKTDIRKFMQKAFYGLPNNDLHSSRYLNLYYTKDKKISEAFELLTQKNKNKLEKLSNYCGGFRKERQKLIEGKKATDFPYDNDIKNLYIQISIGKEAFNGLLLIQKKFSIF